MTSKTKRVLILACLLLTPTVSANGTTIDPFVWQQLVVDADFVGIAECTTAGGTVAEYVVVESWKGPKAGTKMSMRIATDYWGEEQYAMVLCGERVLVTAFRSRAPSRLMSFSAGGGVPLWWRHIQSDFRLPLFQGMIRDPANSQKFFDSNCGSLAEFKKAACSLISQTPEQQELVLLRALSDKYLLRRLRTKSDWNPLSDEEKESLTALAKTISQIDSVPMFVDQLLRFARENPKHQRNVFSVMSQAGAKQTLEILERKGDALPFDESYREYLLKRIRLRAGQPPVDDAPLPKEDGVPASAELERLEAILTAKEKSREWGKAFNTLTVHRPAAVRDYLVAWVNPRENWRDENLGYVLGSYFAWKCGGERKEHLIALLAAKSAYVRVAGAVYLCFEDRELGMQELDRLLALEGDPGAWAALALARRGRNSAVPRALQVFKTPGATNMVGVPHKNLQKRVLVLLSNSSKTSGVDMPAVKWPIEDRTVETFATLSNWWEQNEERITLHDPWFENLEKQKVD